MTSLWCNFIIRSNVVANSNLSCLLISASKVYWTVQPTAARQSGRFNNMHGALLALHGSLNNASMRTAHKMLVKEQWPPNNSPNLYGMEISCVRTDARSSFEPFSWPKQFLNQKSHRRTRVKNALYSVFLTRVTGEDMEQVHNKTVQSFTNSLSRVRGRWRKTF